MHAGILQKGYVHPRWNLSTKSITSKEDWQKFPLSQKKRVLIIISLILWGGVSSPPKTLLFLYSQIVQKIACGITCQDVTWGIEKIVWPYNCKSFFTIKSFYQRLYNGRNCPDFPVKTIWDSKAPMKVCFFAWVATEGKILTCLKEENQFEF